MTPELWIRVNGGPPQRGGITVPSGAAIGFVFPDTNGWTKYRLEVVGPPGWTPPAPWTLQGGATSVIEGVITPPANITLPVVTTAWGKWMATLIVNDVYVDQATAWSTLSPAGVEDLGVGEAAQFNGPVRKWVGAIQQALRTLGGGANATPARFHYELGGPASSASLDPLWETLGLAWFRPEDIIPVVSGRTRHVQLELVGHTTNALYEGRFRLYDMDGITNGGTPTVIGASALATNATTPTKLTASLDADLGTVTTGGLIAVQAAVEAPGPSFASLSNAKLIVTWD
jgi:hypothetical protein